MSRWCHAAACNADLPAEPSEWSHSSSNMMFSMTAVYLLNIQAPMMEYSYDLKYLFERQSQQY